MAGTQPWEVSDALWGRVAPFVPPPSHAKGGRPRVADRPIFAAPVDLLRSGDGGAGAGHQPGDALPIPVRGRVRTSEHNRCTEGPDWAGILEQDFSYHTEERRSS